MNPAHKHRVLPTAALAFALCIPFASPCVAQGQPPIPPAIQLLRAFRPIGGSGNNLLIPAFNAVPGSPELSLAPLNFVPHTNDGLVPGPNPRTISNVIAGGTGGNGQYGQTNDPVASAWLYVFGQLLDHDLDLEQTPPTSPPMCPR